MPKNYKYDQLKKELEKSITKTDKDVQIVRDFITKYNLKRTPDRTRGVPDYHWAYNTYKAFTGKKISELKAPVEPEPVNIKGEGVIKNEIPDVTEVHVESEDPPIVAKPEPETITAPADTTAPLSATPPAGEDKPKKLIDLGKLGIIIADFESFVYRRNQMRPLSEPERVETVNAVSDVINNRVKIASTESDIVNAGIVIGSHVVSRVGEKYMQAAQPQQKETTQQPLDPMQPRPIDPKTGSVIWG